MFYLSLDLRFFQAAISVCRPSTCRALFTIFNELTYTYQVYNLSLLSSVPSDLADDLPQTLSQRVNPIFNVGVHDIPFLEKFSNASTESTSGWIGCTSDELLSTKPSLSDVRIRVAENIGAPQTQSWPSVTSTQLGPIKATQRDLRRYKALRQGLSHLQDRHTLSPSLSRSSSNRNINRESLPANDSRSADNLSADSSILEPAPWAAVLYDSFLWWASAGARRSADLDVEQEQDGELFAAALEVWDACEGQQTRGALEMAVVAYFQRLTMRLLEGLGELVEGAGEEEGEEEERRLLAERQGTDGASSDPATVVETADLVGLGLDGWSQLDRQFVVELSRMYFEKKVKVKGTSVEWCGVRVC